jgi:hypothetical protein
MLAMITVNTYSSPIMMRLMLIVLTLSTPISSPAQTPTPMGSLAPAQPTPGIAERALELTAQFDQRILSTVYWCLGTLITVFLFLIGYNWFANFRAHERDLRTLKEEIKNTVDKATETISSAVQSSLEAQIESRIAPIKQALATLKGASLKEDVQRWMDKKVYINALRLQVAYLRHADESNTPYQINEGLDMLQNIFKIISGEGQTKPDAGLIGETAAMLQAISARNPTLVANLQSQLSDLRK